MFSASSRVLQAGVAPLAAVLLIAVAAPGASTLATPAAQPGAQPGAQPAALPVLTAPGDVNGVVVCSGSTRAYMGFEAQHDGAAWTLTAVPYVSEGDEHGENLNHDADDPAPEPEHTDDERHTTDPATREEPAPTKPLEGVATSAWLAGLGVIERYAAYEPQSACSPTAKAGTVTMKDTLLGTYPATRNLGIARACHLGGRSEHKEGRAFDWGAYVNRPVERASVEQFLTQLLATDADGNRHALARRMGVMYVIWNGQIWSAYRPGDGWRRYGGPNPHTDHVHVSLSRAGGAGRTSFFTQGLGAKGVLSQVPPGASAINTSATIAPPAPSAPAPSATTVGHRRTAPGTAPSEPTAGTRRRSDARQTDDGDAGRRERFREAAARWEQEQTERRARREAAGERWRAEREAREAGATERREAWKQAQAEEEARRTERRERRAAEETRQRTERQERKTTEEVERQRAPEEAVAEPEVTGSADEGGREQRRGKRDGGGRKRGRNR